ncbi:subunit 9 of transcription initiation factor TFIID [Chloropicon primus]|uniref:Subunit 9 of transcription initiation factor TFIID n=2 Tax=Chloropicon primus TaxID=1764295 RepID=A0A5B8MIL2_9CHLO|nr:subunit 9 of transcription initiation factor TFIID [Chloropicon primus]UPQ99439.1 subunit 9 of transcription initiation factor TFIID [Chloropicon primus]|eukprot:QDZ20229.1 subunit 9 of transcription initiation factor TFIID [Chloropicon primus]
MAEESGSGRVEGELEMVMPAAGAGIDGVMASNHVPYAARVVADLLKEMGVEEYEPRVVYQLLEFITTYAHGVLNTAEEYAEHAGRVAEEIVWQDIALAIGKSRGPQVDPLGVFEPVVPSGFPAKPNAQLLKTMAERINAQKLPDLSKKAGLSLPGDEKMLTAQNFDIN